MNIRVFDKKTYLLGFAVVMIVNICLASFVIRAILAQTTDDKFKNQPPIVAEVSSQKNSPLLITTVNIDNSDSAYQAVNYVVQNISGQPVKGYVILGSGKNVARIVTNFFPVKPFQTEGIVQDELSLERSDIQPSDILFLSVDYVEFEDGSFWGEDTQGQSEQITGGRAGVESAIEELKKIIDRRETATLTVLLDKELASVKVPLPNSVQNEKWRKGFERGYKGVLYFLKSGNERDVEKISKKLDEIKKKNQAERRQRQ